MPTTARIALAYHFFQDSIKPILIQCITLIVKLKTEITNLVRFFKTMSMVVQFVVDRHINPYVDTIKAVTGRGEDPGEVYKVGSYTLTDLQQSVS